MPRKGDIKLTQKQSKILTFVIKFIAEQGYAPSIRDIGDRFGIKSTNGVFDHLNSLERKGYIRRDRNQARSIVVLKNPEGGAFRTPLEAEVEKLLDLLGDAGLPPAIKRQATKVRGLIH